MKEISIKEQIRRRGYSSEIEPYIPTTDFIVTAAQIGQLDTNKKINNLYHMSIEDAISDTNIFFKVLYKLHDVPYMKYKINTPFFKIVKRQLISPFDLPVFSKTVSDDYFYGDLITALPKDGYEEIAFLGITLNSLVSELTSCIYTHEITHSQIDSVYGAVKNYYNSEVISIFVELQIAELLNKGEKILRIEDSRRIYEIENLARELKDYHQKRLEKSEDDALLDSKYTISDVRAYNLFSEYYYGSKATKEYIRSRIQSIFDGKCSVEELLNEFMDLNPTNDLNPKLTFSNKTIKYFNR